MPRIILKFLLMTGLYFIFLTSAYSQFQRPQLEPLPGETYYVNYNFSEISTIELVREVFPDNQMNWMKEVITYSNKHKGPDIDLISTLKEEKLREKTIFESLNLCLAFPEETFLADDPLKGNAFEANLPLQGTPPDNTIAVSNSGIIVSAINSNLMYFLKNGTKLFEKTFYDFLGDTNLNSKLYDPTLIYDSWSDRFILTLLHGSTSNTSKLIVAFSKSGNPMDGWNVYYIPAKTIYPAGGKWFDYPNVGMSVNDFFITVNVFYDNENFSEVLILQMQKERGYKGYGLSYKKWQDLKDADKQKPFTMVPMSYGHNGNVGPGIFFISTKSAGSNAIYLYEIKKDLSDNPGTSDLVSYKVPVPAYSVPGDALQKYTGTSNPGMLDCGDCRVQDGFMLDYTIHFAFNCEYASGYSGICYNRLNVLTRQIETKRFGQAGYDIAYPAIASSSPNGSNEKDIIFAYLKSGSDIYPQFCAGRCDNDMNFSPGIVIKSGETHVNIVDGDERWGDYNGIARQHSTTAPSVWISGSYGSNINDLSKYPPIINKNKFKTYIAEMTDQMLNAIPEKNTMDVTLAPNPVMDIMNLELDLSTKSMLDISIYNLSGQKLTTLFNDRAGAGKFYLTFNRNALPDGIYFLNVKSDNQLIKSEKIILSH